MSLPKEWIEFVIAQGNLAPSVHNTQPTRWNFEGDNLRMSIDQSVLLQVGDPHGSDAAMSLGCAFFATRMALEGKGWGVSKYEIEDGAQGPIVHAKLAPQSYASEDWKWLAKRFVERRGFAKASPDETEALHLALGEFGNCLAIREAEEIDYVSQQNERASRDIMRAKAFRYELLNWMRLKRDDARFAKDGLNLDALAMSNMEGRLANLVLRNPTYAALDKLGLSKGVISEHDKTLSSALIALLHVKQNTHPVEAGMAIMALWMRLTELGFVAWPMASVCDHEDVREEIARRYQLSENERIVFALRVGKPMATPYARARRPAAELQSEVKASS